MATPKKAKKREVPAVAKRVVNDVERAARSLPAEDWAAYRKVRRSVVSARRHAESKEGRLRID